MAEKKKITRTEIKELGRVKALEQLFKESGLENSETVLLSGKEERKSYNFVSCNKMMLEGVDFDLTYVPLKYLGYKAALLGIGTVYSKGYAPYSLSFTIGVSSKFSFEHISDLWAGIRSAAKIHSVSKITFDLTPSMSGLMISCTATGREAASVTEKFPKASANSLICINGNLGSACMGFYVLEREKQAFTGKQPDLAKYKYPLSQYLTPEIEPNIISSLAEAGVWPSAGYFMTRGLGDTVKQLSKDLGCGADIYLDKIPVAPEARTVSEEIGIDIVTAIVNGGDDYRLLYVFPLEAHDKIRKELPFLEVVGHTTKEGCYLVSPDGNRLEIKAQGWQ